MLAIDVERDDATSYLAEAVKVPDLAPNIDHLWLLVRASADGNLHEAFYAKRDARRLERMAWIPH